MELVFMVFNSLVGIAIGGMGMYIIIYNNPSRFKDLRECFDRLKKDDIDIVKKFKRRF